MPPFLPLVGGKNPSIPARCGTELLPLRIEPRRDRTCDPQIKRTLRLPHTSLYGVILCYIIGLSSIIQHILTYFELCRVTVS
jgi:hypothetical protein